MPLKRLDQESRINLWKVLTGKLEEDYDRNRGCALDSSNEDGDHHQLSYLGVKATLQQDTDPLFLFGSSAYTTLPRPKKLPGSCPISVKRKDIQDLVEKLWYGDGSCRFAPDLDIDESSNRFVLVVYMADDDDSNDGSEEEVKNGKGPFTLVVLVDSKPNLRPGQDEPLAIMSVRCDMLEAFLSRKELNLLGARALHQFLRQFGFSFIIKPQVLSHLRTHITTMWRQSRKYNEEALDAEILFTDLFLLYPSEDNEAYNRKMTMVGESLESVGMFEEAASVYLDTATYIIHKDSAELLSNAGLAYKRNMDFDSSFECYVFALEILARTKGDANNWNLNDAKTSLIVSNFSTLYMHIQRRAEESNGNSEDIYLALCWFSLLAAAGFRFKSEQALDRVQKCQGILKSAYARPKIAKKTIVDIFKEGTVVGHKERLLRTANTNTKLSTTPMQFISPRDPTEQRNKYIKEAQGLIKGALKKQTRGELCACCGTLAMEADVVRCSCDGNVVYCSEECRLEHWRNGHKHECAIKVGKCNHCGARQVGSQILKDCACKAVAYCSETCQKDDWEDHKMHCKKKVTKKKGKAGKGGKKKNRKK